MKKITLFTVILCLSVIIQSPLFAQVAINTDASLPHPSAILDVKHPNKGLLIPRVALTGFNDVVTIPSPAVSLLVYNTSNGVSVTPGYYYWNGNSWVSLGTSGGPGLNNAWLLTGNAGTVDGTNFIGTTDNVPFNIRVNNERAGRIDHLLANTFWGYRAGNTNTGSTNTGFGHEALFSNTQGTSNTAIGVRSLWLNTLGLNNTATGYVALQNNVGGDANTANGTEALFANTEGNRNTAIGRSALAENSIGDDNTASGQDALQNNSTGNQNTAHGASALAILFSSVFSISSKNPL